MKNNILIIPYAKIDGIRNFNDSFIKTLYERIIEEGNSHVFNDGIITTSDEFLQDMKNNSKLNLLYYSGKLSAICWLNRLDNRSARLHWCGFKDINPRKFIRIGRYFLKEVTSLKNNNGDYIFNVIIGHTPKSNQQAIRYAELSGMTIVGEVPNLCWNEREGRSEDGVISYYTRQEILTAS